MPRRWWAGIDWSTGLQDVAVIDDDGALVTHLRVEETHEGVEQILRAFRDLNPRSHRFSRRQVLTAIEDGNRLLVHELRRTGQPVVVVPPAVTARYRGRRGAAVSKSDRGDAILLADIIRQNPDQRRTMPHPSDEATAIAVMARSQSASATTARKQMLRLRSHLSAYFPAAAEAWADRDQGLRRPEARAVLALAPTPELAANLPASTIREALAGAGRFRLLEDESWRLRELFVQPRLRVDPATEGAMGHRTRLMLAQMSTACDHADELAQAADVAFAAHPHYPVYRSFPSCGPLIAARVFAELGDDLQRFPTARGLRAYAGTAPITWSSGTSHAVTHRQVCNRALKTTVHHWSFGAITRSPGFRALYDARRDHGDGYAAALRHVGGRLLSGLHHCLRTGQLYKEEEMFRNGN